jgi:hypothetical protein
MHGIEFANYLAVTIGFPLDPPRRAKAVLHSVFKDHYCSLLQLVTSKCTFDLRETLCDQATPIENNLQAGCPVYFLGRDLRLKKLLTCQTPYSDYSSPSARFVLTLLFRRP